MPDILGNVVAFIIAVGVIIFVHEAGHLLAAKGFGVRVYTFSLGFGKRLWGFQRGETEYRVSLIPLGGYVRLGGEDPSETSDDPRDFVNKPRWQRVVVYLAGPAMNVVLAVVLVAGVFMVGVEGAAALREIPPVVGMVAEGSPAEAAGIQPGDRILEIDGREVARWEEVFFAVATSPESPLELTLLRDQQRLTTTLVPGRVPQRESGEAGFAPEVLPRVTQVLAGSPAEEAGFQVGDEVRAVDGQGIGSAADFVAYIEERPGVGVEVQVLRAGEWMSLEVVPAEENGRGRIGVGLGLYHQYGPAEAVVESVRYNIEIIHRIFSVLGKIFTGELAARAAVSGPIEIAAVSGAAARTGVIEFIFLTGLISISIGILNLLPIPVLDGGQIVILAIESVMRRDLSMRVKERINQLGFFLLIMIMVAVIYLDLAKTIPRLFGSS